MFKTKQRTKSNRARKRNGRNDKKLIQQKAAYENEGHVYFSISSFKKYGNLSNKKIEELKVGARVEVSNFKKDPLDFIL